MWSQNLSHRFILSLNGQACANSYARSDPTSDGTGYATSAYEMIGSSSYNSSPQAPGFAPSGVFKPAYLVTLSDAADGTAADNDPVSHPLLVSQSNGLFIEESTLEITKVGQNPNVRPDESADWLVNVTLAIRSIRADPNPTIIVSIPELNVNSGPLKLSAIPAATDTPTFVSAAFTVPEGLPQRWYPHTLGTPKLYNITVALNVAGLPVASYTTRSGFRTTFLVQTPYSQEDVEQRGITPGDQWHFEVNGKTIYSKGSNITPLDVFYPRITTDKVRWILESVVKGGQNMVCPPARYSVVCMALTSFCLYSCALGAEASISLRMSSPADTTSTPCVMNSASSSGPNSASLTRLTP